MVETVPADRTDKPLRVAVLPWRLWCGRPIPNAHRSNAADEGSAIDTISRAMPAHYGLRPDDGKCVAGIRKHPADPPQHQLVRRHERQSGRLTPAQHNDLLPKHEDFC